MGTDSAYDVAMELAVKLCGSINGEDVDETRKLYEETLKTVSRLQLAGVEEVFKLVDDDFMFCTLYLEIWYRFHIRRSDHVSPSLYQRIHSWNNYCRLFQDLLRGTVYVKLPHEWLWDMLDEFVNQFLSFSQHLAFNPKTKPDSTLLEARHEAWSVYYVCDLLERFIKESPCGQILDGDLQLLTAAEDDGCRSNLSKALGYFSMVALSRIHCLLGDYQNGLKCLLPIDMSRPEFYSSLIPTHVTVIYHYGFANLMLGRYADAIRAFSNILACNLQNEKIRNKVEQMYALLAICLSLCSPQLQLIDATVRSQLMGKYGEKMSIMQRYDDDAVALYGELLSFAWPPFSTPFAPRSGHPREALSQEEYDIYDDDEDMALAYPEFFGPAALKYEGPLVNHNLLEAVIPNMLRSKQK